MASNVASNVAIFHSLQIHILLSNPIHILYSLPWTPSLPKPSPPPISCLPHPSVTSFSLSQTLHSFSHGGGVASDFAWDVQIFLLMNLQRLLEGDGLVVFGHHHGLHGLAATQATLGSTDNDKDQGDSCYDWPNGNAHDSRGRQSFWSWIRNNDL